MTVSLKAELKLGEEVRTGPDGQRQELQIHEIMDIKREFNSMNELLSSAFKTLEQMHDLKRQLSCHNSHLESEEFNQECLSGNFNSLKTVFKKVRYEYLQETINKLQSLLKFMNVQILVHQDRLEQSCKKRRKAFLKDIVLRRTYSADDFRSYKLCKAKVSNEGDEKFVRLNLQQ